MSHALRSIVRHRPAWSVAVVFASNSFLFGSWLVRLPEIQASLGLSEGDLGLALLGLPLGSLLTMPMTGRWCARLGSGRIAYGGLLVAAVATVLPVLAWNLGTLLAAFVLGGMANGLKDVSMNTRAAEVESALGQTIMASFHGFFSLGGLLAGAIGAGLAWLGWTPIEHVVCTSAIAGVAALALRPGLYEDLGLPPQEGEEPAFALPNKAVAGLAALAFVTVFTEGTVSDWSTVYLGTTLAQPPALAGLGFSGFMGAMAIGRFTGDALTDRFGEVRIVQVGGALAAVGLAFGLWAGTLWSSVIGFVCVGLGYSGIIPILFRAAARTPGRPASIQLASVATMGYLGWFLAPPVVGFLAEAVGLRLTLGLVVFIAAGTALAASSLTSRQRAAVKQNS
ncbi:MAG: MFS transporter [Bacteroidota bacterium]